jgi:hypothetical protein
MEAVKGLVYDRGEVTTPDKKKAYKYLVSVVLVTDEPLTGLSKTGETIIIGGSAIGASLSPALDLITKKYEPPYPLGEAGSAIIQISTMNPDDLKKVK